MPDVAQQPASDRSGVWTCPVCGGLVPDRDAVLTDEQLRNLCRCPLGRDASDEWEDDVA